MTIRFAILAGVSTDAQATPEKLSIPDQLTRCRERIAQSAGFETAGPYIMDGYSRTGYDSLEVAMQEIPPLAQAIHAAAADQYDVLIMDNFDRLGDLGFIVKTRFKKLRKQLYSIRQSGKLTDPAHYDPYASESDDVAMYVEGIIQSYRINKIRRGWNIGVPERARKGLHPLSIPFGYRSAGKDQPTQQVEEEVRLIREMVDSYLAGHTLQSIVDAANASGPKPPRGKLWTRTVVKRIILNQFYAGTTTFGKYKTYNGKRLPVPQSEWVSGQGQHTPIHDQETYLAILSESERRAGLRARVQNYALTGLLTCAVCGGILHRHGALNTPYPVNLTCDGIPHHVIIQYSIALKIIANKLVSELTHVTPPETVENAGKSFLEAITAQEELRREIQEGYKAKIYTRTEAAHEISMIDNEIARLKRQADRSAQTSHNRQQLLQLAQQDLSILKNWIIHDDPTTVNRLLTALIERIEVTPSYDLTIYWR
jgi:DNA invertase Pin-like site-specific DNA recombinase